MSGEKFDKRIGRLRVISYSGSSPRWVEVSCDDHLVLHGLTMEEVRDLHYALGRLLDER